MEKSIFENLALEESQESLENGKKNLYGRKLLPAYVTSNQGNIMQRDVFGEKKTEGTHRTTRRKMGRQNFSALTLKKDELIYEPKLVSREDMSPS